jgi:RNA polymerase sigma factor (sigma-70 family)
LWKNRGYLAFLTFLGIIPGYMRKDRESITSEGVLTAPDSGFTNDNINNFFETNSVEITRLVNFAVGGISGGKELDRNAYEEDFQNGILRVAAELPGFDPEKSSLASSIVRWAKFGIIDGLRQNDPVSRTTRKKMKTFSEDILRNCSSDGENSSLFHALNPPISLEALSDQFDAISDGRGLRPTEDEVELKLVATDSIGKFIKSQKNSEKGKRNISILTLYIKGVNGREIGEELGISESRVNQILHKDIFPWFQTIFQ